MQSRGLFEFSPRGNNANRMINNNYIEDFQPENSMLNTCVRPEETM